jgi:integrating conjugative element protein (TIGR03765 family)
MVHQALLIWEPFKMRTLSFFIFWCLITTCYALKVIALEMPVIKAAPYLGSKQTLQENHKEHPDLEEFPLPVSSRISAGAVTTHTMKQNLLSHALFVVGDDALSRAWLKKHARQLQKLHAIGFVTNVATSTALHELIELAGLPLAPVDIDELALLFDAPHYPFVYDAGVVWQ